MPRSAALYSAGVKFELHQRSDTNETGGSKICDISELGLTVIYLERVTYEVVNGILSQELAMLPSS
jgi:hypothetical protein